MGDAESRAFDVEWEAQFGLDERDLLAGSAGTYGGSDADLADNISREMDRRWDCGHRWITCPDCGVEYQDDDECPCSRDLIF